MRIYLTLILGILSFVAKAQISISNKKSLEIDRYIEHIMLEQKIPGLSLAITQKGRVLKKSNYGLSSIECNIPITDSSAFWLASVSKHFTATAIMQLFEKGILNLDDEIHKYLPDAPINWKGVTIRHLLTHTSGLPGSGKGGERGNRSAKGSYSAEQMYKNAKNDTLNFNPGEDFLYSDEGIFLLGYIINQVSEMSFKDYINNKIFKPSKMNNSYLMDQFKIHPNQVFGYSKKNDEIIPDRNSWRLIDTEINAAGGVYASINDMINWEYSMTTNFLVSQKSKDSMWSSYKLKNGRPTYYGFCWNTQTIQNKRIIYHPGVSGTEYMRFVDDSISIIILTNQAKYEKAISQKVAEIIGVSPNITEKDIKTETVSKKQPNRKEFEKLIGEYDFFPNENYYLEGVIKMDIVIKGNDLWIEYPAKKEYRKQWKLEKLENGRWIQLSWEPTFVETNFEIVNENNEVSFNVFENYGLGYDVQVGVLKKAH
ncbi:MAG: serine hydrolase domain-containing protein [Christiangramia sp.]|nr:serine hydrolase domain-containing protein [Christiangramia sp.]